MFGPKPKGTWSGSRAQNCGETYQFLSAGQRYRVIQAFVDHDADPHPVGETWFFAGQCFVPYDDGLSLFVSLDGEQEWHFRMQWRPEEQGPILDNLAQYIAAAPAG